MRRVAAFSLSIMIVLSAVTTGCSKGATRAPDGATDSMTAEAAMNSETDNGTSATTKGPVAPIVPSSDKKGEVVITETEATDPVMTDPTLEWQYDLSFPEWQDRSMYGANNRLGFYSYSGQGTIYVTLSDDAGDFNLYINDKRMDTSGMTPGKTYTIDISGITRNGTNSLQLSDLKEGNVKVKIPYPIVIDGTIADVGIQEGAIELIDAIISSDIEYGFPSAQVAIIKDGRLVYENSWGKTKDYDDDGNPVDAPPVTADTLYDLASVTKVYSCTFAIQYLVTQGLLDLDTKIVDILGSGFAEDTIDIEYKGSTYIPLSKNKEWKAQITVRDLLRHQGGFPAGPLYYNDRYDNSIQDLSSHDSNILYVGTAADDAAREKTLQMIFKTPLLYQPESKVLYSDLDFMILCFCVEKITGMGLDEYLEEVFWAPLGLTHITYRPLDHGFTTDDIAATELYHEPKEEIGKYRGMRTTTIHGVVHDPNAYYSMAGISGHAGLFSNATDLAILGSVMLTGGYGNHRFFSQDVLDEFTAIQNEDYPGYALGWWREGDHTRDYYFGSVTDSRAFGHQGFTGTFSMIDPENNMVIVILTNKLHSKMEYGDFAGKRFQTSWLGFVPEILEIGLNGEEVDPGIWASMAGDMAAVAKRTLDDKGITDHDHPLWKAYESLLAAQQKVS
ncbi:MAG: serine hydrolase [Clostridiales bacterium]|nr:serine hydrolase [Clostridiales bacterium]